MAQGDPPVYQLVDSNGNVQAEIRHDLAQSLIIDQLNGSDIDFQQSDLSNIASVSTDDLQSTAISDTRASLFSALSQGYVVGLSAAGYMEVVDPGAAANDTTAIQTAVDYLVAQGQSGELHIPALKPDGTEFSIDNPPVIVGDQDGKCLIDVHGHGFGENVGPSITTSSNDGTELFLITGNTSGGFTIRGPQVRGLSFNMGGNDAPAFRFVRTNNFYAEAKTIRDFSGVGVVVDSASYGFRIDDMFFSPNQSTATCFEFRDSLSFGPGPGNGVIGPGVNVQSPHAVGITDPGGATGLRIMGHWEGAEGNAELEFTNADSSVFFTPGMTIAGAAAGSADGIYWDGGDTVIAPSQVIDRGGDGIRVSGNADRLIVSPYIRAKGNSGDVLNIEGLPNAHSVVPREGTFDGTVSYPGLPWSNLYYNDGLQPFNQGTQTVSAGSTAEAVGFAGNAGEDLSVEWWVADDPNADVEIQLIKGWDDANGQMSVKFQELSGAGSVDVGWRVLRG